MNRVKSLRGLFIFLSLLIASGSFPIFGQTTIFNIPSTDTIPKSLFYIEADFLAHFGPFEKGGFQSYGYRAVYGVKNNFEVGTNFFYTRLGKGISAKEFQPNFKWKTYTNEKYGIGASTGAMFFVPLDKQAGTRTYSLIYSNISKVVDRAGGLRLTGGIYTIVGAKRDIGTKTGAIIGIEQPLRRRLSFIGDWYSGRNRFGYAAAGLNYAISSKQFVLAGYNFGNTGRANNFFSAFYGYTF